MKIPDKFLAGVMAILFVLAAIPSFLSMSHGNSGASGSGVQAESAAGTSTPEVDWQRPDRSSNW